MVKPATTPKPKDSRHLSVTQKKEGAASAAKALGNEITIRKTRSLNRVKELGLKSLKIDLDERAYEKLQSIYEAVGFKLINRKDASQLKGEDVSSLLSYIIWKLDKSENKFDKDYGVCVFLSKIRRIIKFRKSKYGESAIQIAEFLNGKKIKRPMYLKLPKYDGQNGGKWIEQNVILLDQSKDLKEAQLRFPKLNCLDEPE